MSSALLSSSLRTFASQFRNASSRIIHSQTRPLPLLTSQASQAGLIAPCVVHRTFLSFGSDKKKTPAPSTIAAITQLIRASTSSVTGLYSLVSGTRYGRLMRLNKTTGTHLAFLPAAWSISLGAATLPEWIQLSVLFYGGAILLRGAGCTINDIWDADIDRKVARTRSRPIASGEISMASAFVLLGAQLSGGLAILSQLKTAAFPIAAFSVLPLMFYPFAKRYTAYPQAVLGLTLNSGALLGYAAATGALTAEPLMLYGAAWCWTMVYDTVYAFQDKADDEKIGVSSTAITFSERPKLAIAVFTAGKVAFLTAAGVLGDLSWPYYAGISLSSLHLASRIASTDLSDSEQCQKAFDSNVTTGIITWLGITLSRVL